MTSFWSYLERVTVNLVQAKARLSELLDKVETGEEVIICCAEWQQKWQLWRAMLDEDEHYV